MVSVSKIRLLILSKTFPKGGCQNLVFAFPPFPDSWVETKSASTLEKTLVILSACSVHSRCTLSAYSMRTQSMLGAYGIGVALS